MACLSFYAGLLLLLLLPQLAVAPPPLTAAHLRGAKLRGAQEPERASEALALRRQGVPHRKTTAAQKRKRERKRNRFDVRHGRRGHSMQPAATEQHPPPAEEDEPPPPKQVETQPPAKEEPSPPKEEVQPAPAEERRGWDWYVVSYTSEAACVRKRRRD